MLPFRNTPVSGQRQVGWPIRPSLLMAIPMVAVMGLALATGIVMGAGLAMPLLVMVFGALLLVICVRWPGVYLATAFVYTLLGTAGPWSEFSLTIMGFSIYSLDIITLFGLALVAVMWVRGLLYLPPRAICLPLFLFVGLCVIWAIWGLVAGYPTRNVFRDVGPVLGYLLVLLGYNAINDDRSFRRWALAFLALGLLTALYALLMRAFGIEAQFGFTGSDTAETAAGVATRAYGFAGATTFYVSAFFLGATTLVAMRQPRLSSNLGMIAVTVVTLVQTLLLFGRGLILGLVAGLATVFLSLSSSARLRLTIAAGAVLVFLLFVAPIIRLPFAEEIISRYASIINPSSAGISAALNAQARNDELDQVWAKLNAAERIVGRGLGARLPVALQLGSVVVVEVYHNSIADALLKIGLLGLAIYFWLTLSVVLYMTQMVKTTTLSPTLVWALGLSAAYIALAVAGWGALGMPLRATLAPSLILGMALAGYRLQADQQE
jgi:hypothetical protein